MTHIEPLRIRRDKTEENFRRVYQSSVDDLGEFEFMIAKIKDGELPEDVYQIHAGRAFDVYRILLCALPNGTHTPPTRGGKWKIVA